jgi:hypothetical protein
LISSAFPTALQTLHSFSNSRRGERVSITAQPNVGVVCCAAAALDVVTQRVQSEMHSRQIPASRSPRNSLYRIRCKASSRTFFATPVEGPLLLRLQHALACRAWRSFAGAALAFRHRARYRARSRDPSLSQTQPCPKTDSAGHAQTKPTENTHLHSAAAAPHRTPAQQDAARMPSKPNATSVRLSCA